MQIRDMVEENARLAERLESALSAAKEHAEVIGERIKKDEQDGEKTVRKLKVRKV